MFLLLFCLWRTNNFGSFSADAVPDSFLEFAFLPFDPLGLLPSYPRSLAASLYTLPSYPPTLLSSYLPALPFPSFLCPSLLCPALLCPSPPTLLPSYPRLLPSYPPALLPSCPPTLLPSYPTRFYLRRFIVSEVQFFFEIYMCIYIIYGDQYKGPRKDFNCANRACYVGNPRESFFRIRESNIFFRERFAKIGYYNHYVKRLPPTAARGPAGEGH